MTTLTVTTQDVLDAATRLEGVVHKTPVLSSSTLDEIVGSAVFLKCENFQRAGAFKIRGAYNAISRLTDEERRRGVITHSSGNHAQGVALASRLLGVRAVVVMPEDAPANKRAATEAYGATVVTCNALVRDEVTRDLIDQHGYTLIHPFDNNNVIAGQGTAALELFQEIGPLDALFVPVGGGGLISGSALAASLLAPDCRVIGVEPAAAADAGVSWRTNEIYTLDAVPVTSADGLRTRAIGQRNLPIMRELVSDMTTAGEDAIMATLEFIWSRLKIVVEPSSAVALAPLFTGAYALPAGSRIGVIISGGNADVSLTGYFKRSTLTVQPATQPAAQATTTTADSPMPRVLVAAQLNTAAMAKLEESATVDWLPDADQADLMSHLAGAQAIIMGRAQRLNGDLLKNASGLRAIGLLSESLDNVDVSMARSLGIDIIQAPGSRAVAIAEHTVGNMLKLADMFGDGRLAGKTLGLIGYGHVGQQVARRARAFDMKILVNQPRLTPELALETDIRQADLVDLLRQSDYVSLHVPYRSETNTLIGAAELGAMKRGSMLINSGHTDLVDDTALLAALDSAQLAGAAVSVLPGDVDVANPDALKLRHHARVLLTPHVTAVLDEQSRDTSEYVVGEIVRVLDKQSSNRLLDLEVVPVEMIVPHEHIDQKRVDKLKGRLEEDGRLVNPPVTTFWKGRYIILDGATRYSALSQLGYPYAIVQVVQEEEDGFQLHTWYHAISVAEGVDAETALAVLFAELGAIEGLVLTTITAEQARAALNAPDSICYFIGRDGTLTLASVAPGFAKLDVMRNIVARYTAWGTVERTLLTDIGRLKAQFPALVAVAVFPQFRPSEVFDAAAEGNLLPAGLTRFVIPGRILRLNADLGRLRADETLAEKRAWFNEFLAGKLSRSRLRYYQEPVVLLDE